VQCEHALVLFRREVVLPDRRVRVRQYVFMPFDVVRHRRRRRRLRVVRERCGAIAAEDRCIPLDDELPAQCAAEAAVA
jgi:hypothetical protein